MNTERQGARVFLVDDHPAVRQGLALLLGHDAHTVCGEAESPTQTLERVMDSQADMALVDLTLGDETGFDLIVALRARGIRVLVYSMHEDSLSIERCFRAGANGYVSKREESSMLLKGVRELMANRSYVSPRAAQVLANRVISSSRTGYESNLSERETQIMDLLGQGRGASEIADLLSISVRTVETYCSRIIEKLELSGMKELRQVAIRSRG